MLHARRRHLLNLLTLERGSGTPSGTVTLNGHAFTLDVFRKHAAIVNQTDQLWAFLTAREHLEYATALYQPSVTASERRASVDRLLADTGLEVCQHTKAGNELFKGLSGGQKRRLSLAVALCKSPRVVFLDEPTSAQIGHRHASWLGRMLSLQLRESFKASRGIFKHVQGC